MSQEFDQTGCSEQLQEAHVEFIDRLGQRAKRKLEWLLTKTINYNLITFSSIYLQVNYDLSDAAQNGDEVKNVPRIPKIVLWGMKRAFQPFFKRNLSFRLNPLSPETQRP